MTINELSSISQAIATRAERKVRGRFVLTPALASAAGLDAGNASMRHAGRTRWNEDDYNTAARETNRLFDIIDVR